jgi:hypothetical protein
MNPVKSENYIYNKNPEFFGNRDDYFQEEGAKTVKVGCNHLVGKY